ncbi:MAG: SRPBCC family protein [Bacteroidia bacterium]
MKFTVETEINQPVEKVVKLFDNPENMKHWQPGLISFETISGTPGQPGAKARLKYKMGKREIEMIETITVNKLPEEFSGTYDAQGVHNIVKNYFIPLGPNKTKYVNYNEFQFKGFMKIIAFLMPGAFKKQSKRFLEDFKKFAESQS